jgi:protein TonB
MASGDTGLFERGLQFALIGAAHAAAIVWLSHAQFGSAPETQLVSMTVRTVELAAPPKPILGPPRPKPPRPEPQMRAAPPPEPPPVLTAEPSTEPEAPAYAVPVQPPPREEPLPVAATSLTAPRFDAAYLRNPAPSYPPISRRLGEAGTVLLRVRVTAQGASERVQVARSSGFPRLDQAASEAVRSWRFVPARRGEEAVTAEVLVPIVFRLDQ